MRTPACFEHAAGACLFVAVVLVGVLLSFQDFVKCSVQPQTEAILNARWLGVSLVA